MVMGNIKGFVFRIAVLVAVAMMSMGMTGGRGISPAESTQPSETQKANCALVDEVIRLKYGKLAFPRTGAFVTESHYATKDETFGESERLFPRTVKEEISRHLETSCALLRDVYGFDLSPGCGEVYRHSWEREWTPPEGGRAGQAARGDLKPTTIQELWQGNFYYASGAMPEPGTKYIVTNANNGKSVVVSFGYEIGPADSSKLGGLTTEVQWALGNTNEEKTRLHIGRAADQSLPYGPVDCAESE